MSLLTGPMLYIQVQHLPTLLFFGTNKEQAEKIQLLPPQSCSAHQQWIFPYNEFRVSPCCIFYRCTSHSEHRHQAENSSQLFAIHFLHIHHNARSCLLYTSDAADERS